MPPKTRLPRKSTKKDSASKRRHRKQLSPDALAIWSGLFKILKCEKKTSDDGKYVSSYFRYVVEHVSSKQRLVVFDRQKSRWDRHKRISDVDGNATWQMSGEIVGSGSTAILRLYYLRLIAQNGGEPDNG